MDTIKFKQKFTRYHIKDGQIWAQKILVSDLTLNSEWIGRGMQSVPLWITYIIQNYVIEPLIPKLF